MMLSRCSVFGAVFFGSSLPPFALCQDQQTEGGEGEVELDVITEAQLSKLHSGMDSDKDGRVSMEEVLAYSMHMRKQIARRDVKTVTDEMDTNGDGKLNLEEVLKDIDQWVADDEEEKHLAAERRALETEKFQVADSNGNGQLELDEVPALFYPETHDGVLSIAVRASMQEKDKDKDGELTPKEFWEGDVADDADLAISSEEMKDFNVLDKDGNGKLNSEEMKAWESGSFHTAEAMKKLFELSDKDSDMHISSKELHEARDQIAGSDAQYHLMEWAEHGEL